MATTKAIRALPSTLRDVAWCRADCECGRQRGSKERAVMHAHAAQVTRALFGDYCHWCTMPMHADDALDVDRATPGDCYVPGNVLLAHEHCNRSRKDKVVPGLRERVTACASTFTLPSWNSTPEGQARKANA